MLGPVAAPIAKLRGKFRFQLQAQAADGGACRPPSRRPPPGLNQPDDRQWMVDVDPLEML